MHSMRWRICICLFYFIIVELCTSVTALICNRIKVCPAQPGLCTVCICGSAFTCASLPSLTRALAKGVTVCMKGSCQRWVENVELNLRTAVSCYVWPDRTVNHEKCTGHGINEKAQAHSVKFKVSSCSTSSCSLPSGPLKLKALCLKGPCTHILCDELCIKVHFLCHQKLDVKRIVKSDVAKQESNLQIQH